MLTDSISPRNPKQTQQSLPLGKRQKESRTYRRKRNVTFCSEVKVNSANYCTSDETWYDPAELEQIKDCTKVEAKRFRSLTSRAVSASATMSSLVLPYRNCGVYKKMKYLVKAQSIINDEYSDPSCSETKFHPQFRGLESRIFTERQRNKTIAMNAVLEYQRRAQLLVDAAKVENKSELEIRKMKRQFAERLSTICSQLSQWSKDEALAAAHFDAEGVYMIPKTQEDSSLPTMEKAASNKRKTICLEDERSQQIKRSRTTVECQ